MDLILTGARENPVDSRMPMELARALMRRCWGGPEGVKGLWYRLGTWWTWYGGMWKKVSEEELGLAVMRELSEMWVQGERDEDGEAGEPVRVGANKRMCDEVVWALKAERELKSVSVPCWVGTPSHRPDAGGCVAFEDVVVKVGEGGVEVVGERGPEWFGKVVPARWEGGRKAECPNWERAVAMWSQGDQAWVTRLRRFGGYLLMGRRDARAMLLLFGKTGGGKGVLSRVFQVLAGSSWFLSMDVETMTSPFGLAEIGNTSTLVVTEMSTTGKAQMGTFSRVAKNILGQDPMPVNDKHRKVQMNVPVACALVVCSNKVPKMENEGQGMSNKVVVLPIKQSFDQEGRDEGLGKKLEAEIEGIAKWFMEGALEYVRVPQRERWPEVEGGQEVMRDFGLANNPIDEFLEARFVKNAEGWVPTELVKMEWRVWKAGTKRAWAREVPEGTLLGKMEQEGSWQIHRARKPGTGARGLRGLSLKVLGDTE